jgi:hypothetical protein
MTPKPSILHSSGRVALRLCAALAAVPLAVSAQTLTHRYSFVSDASDSVGGANGTPMNGATISNGAQLSGGTSGPGCEYIHLNST